MGGLNIIGLENWNKANMIRLLRNLIGKNYSLWINGCTAIMSRNKVSCLCRLGLTLLGYSRVSWNKGKLLENNPTRPRALFTLWMACHYKLEMKERLKIIGMLNDDKYWLYGEQDTREHLFFKCGKIQEIWKKC